MGIPKPTAWWGRFSNSWIGAILLAAAAAVAVVAGVPYLVSAASANTQTANPVPTHHVHWEGGIKQFAGTIRASLGETWDILAAYSHSKNIPNAPLPHVIVADQALITGCRDETTLYTVFNPAISLAANCPIERRVYLSNQGAMAYGQRFGAGQLLAYLSTEILHTKASGHGNAYEFTACVAGAWLGYLERWGNIDTALKEQASGFFGSNKSVFQLGYENRSLTPCLAT